MHGEQVSVLYPTLLKVTGDIKRAHFLNDVAYRWNYHGGKSFYNFVDKALKHPDYRLGQSWYELIGLTAGTWRSLCHGNQKTDFGIVTRIDRESAKAAGHDNKKDYLRELLKSDAMEHLVIINGDISGKTWHFLNRRSLEEKVGASIAERDQQMLEDMAEIRENLGFDDEFEYEISEWLKDDPEEEAKHHLNKNNAKTLFSAKIKQSSLPGTGKWGPMHDSYFVSSEVIDFLVEEGYNIIDLQQSAARFKHHYTKGKGAKKPCKDWDEEFRVMWVETDYGYGKIRKNGIFAGDKPSQVDIYKQLYSVKDTGDW